MISLGVLLSGLSAFADAKDCWVTVLKPDSKITKCVKGTLIKLYDKDACQEGNTGMFSYFTDEKCSNPVSVTKNGGFGTVLPATVTLKKAKDGTFQGGYGSALDGKSNGKTVGTDKGEKKN